MIEVHWLPQITLYKRVQAIEIEAGRSFITRDSWRAVFPLVRHDPHV